MADDRQNTCPGPNRGHGQKPVPSIDSVYSTACSEAAAIIADEVTVVVQAAAQERRADLAIPIDAKMAKVRYRPGAGIGFMTRNLGQPWLNCPRKLPNHSLWLRFPEDFLGALV